MLKLAETPSFTGRKAPRKRFFDQITFVIKTSHRVAAEKYAISRDTNLSQICREAMAEYLKNHNIPVDETE